MSAPRATILVADEHAAVLLVLLSKTFSIGGLHSRAE